jgi:hypothetical protein
MYIHITDAGIADDVSMTNPATISTRPTPSPDGQWLSTRDIVSIEQAEKIAADLASMGIAQFIVIDHGKWVSHRFDLVIPPQIGDEVSKAFNGDYYPDGKVIHVTKGTFRIVKTDTGGVYYRRGKTGSWIRKGGTWSLVQGHINRRNPSF